MKSLLKILCVGFLLIVSGGLSVVPRQQSPMTVDWIGPTNGATVSGTINLQCQAHSTASPIVKVEFYRDGVLIGTLYPPLPPTITIVEK